MKLLIQYIPKLDRFEVHWSDGRFMVASSRYLDRELEFSQYTIQLAKDNPDQHFEIEVD